MTGQIILGVGGGIAAYKVASLLRLITESGAQVTVIPTEAALRFVGEATWAALSGQPVRTQLWQDVHAVPQVSLAKSARLLVVAPATADLIARAATGQADDLLTATLLMAKCPVIFAPAMHTEMWQHPATVANVALLRSRGVRVLDPAQGRLTGADSGPGRLPEPEQLWEAVQAQLCTSIQDLGGRKVLISAGGTREPLDPVRFLGNRSSGKQGRALAATALARGAEVTLVSTMGGPGPAGVRTLFAETAAELGSVMVAEADSADVVIMAAAVADFRVEPAEHKIKKQADQESLHLKLIQTPDILAQLSKQRKPGQVVVGFAAETGDTQGDPLSYGRAKLARKGCNLLVVNDVSEGKVFGDDLNAVTILRPEGAGVSQIQGTKFEVASAIWREVFIELGSANA